MKDLLLLAAAMLLVIWDVSVNHMAMLRTVVHGAKVLAAFVTG